MLQSSGKISLKDIAKEFCLKKPYGLTKPRDILDNLPNGKLSIGNYYGVSKHPIKEILIFEDQDYITNELNTRVPQTLLDVFNSWGRFDGEKFYTDKSTAAGNAAAWTWDTGTSSVLMPLNVSPANGFVSNSIFDSFDFSVTLSSSSRDDDAIGLIAAFKRESSTNTYISFVSTNGGAQPFTGIGVYLNYTTSTRPSKLLWSGTITTNSNASQGTGWSSRKIRLRIKRDGDKFEFYHSEMGSEILYIAPAFTLDLNSDSDLYGFKGKQKYGYITYSQPYSTYKNIEFSGGTSDDLILDIPNDKIWNFNTSLNIWESTSTDITSLGYEYLIINPEGENGIHNIYKLSKTGFSKLGTYIEQYYGFQTSPYLIPETYHTKINQSNKIVGLYKIGVFENFITSPIDIINVTDMVINIPLNTIDGLKIPLDGTYAIMDNDMIYSLSYDDNSDGNVNIYGIDKFKEIILI